MLWVLGWVSTVTRCRLHHFTTVWCLPLWPPPPPCSKLPPYTVLLPHLPPHSGTVGPATIPLSCGLRLLALLRTRMHSRCPCGCPVARAQAAPAECPANRHGRDMAHTGASRPDHVALIHTMETSTTAHVPMVTRLTDQETEEKWAECTLGHLAAEVSLSRSLRLEGNEPVKVKHHLWGLGHHLSSHQRE